MRTVLCSASNEVAIGPEEPFCIDSSIVEALEAGLAAYDGKALAG